MTLVERLRDEAVNADSRISGEPYVAVPCRLLGDAADHIESLQRECERFKEVNSGLKEYVQKLEIKVIELEAFDMRKDSIRDQREGK